MKFGNGENAEDVKKKETLDTTSSVSIAAIDGLTKACIVVAVGVGVVAIAGVAAAVLIAGGNDRK